MARTGPSKQTIALKSSGGIAGLAGSVWGEKLPRMRQMLFPLSFLNLHTHVRSGTSLMGKRNTIKANTNNLLVYSTKQAGSLLGRTKQPQPRLWTLRRTPYQLSRSLINSPVSQPSALQLAHFTMTSLPQGPRPTHF